MSSGEEMATKARELARHFETQGTPVMIGALCQPQSIFVSTVLAFVWLIVFIIKRRYRIKYLSNIFAAVRPSLFEMILIKLSLICTHKITYVGVIVKRVKTCIVLSPCIIKSTNNKTPCPSVCSMV